MKTNILRDIILAAKQKVQDFFSQKRSRFFVVSALVGICAFSILVILVMPKISHGEAGDVNSKSPFQELVIKESSKLNTSIQDVEENINNGRYDKALLQLKGLFVSADQHNCTKEERATIEYFMAKVYGGKDSLELAVQHIKKSIDQMPSQKAFDLFFELIDKLILLNPDDVGYRDIKIFYLEKYRKIVGERLEGYSFEKVSNKISFLDIKNYQNLIIPKKSKVHLFSIGLNEYQDKRIKDIWFGKKDALEISESFSKIFLDDIDIKITNLLGKDATKDRIIASLSEIKSKVSGEDFIIFYFSGHGYSIGDKRFILPYDTDIENLDSSIIHLNTVYNRIRQISNRSLVLIDACNTDYKSKNRYLEKLLFNNNKNQVKLEHKKISSLNHGRNTYQIIVNSSSDGEKSHESKKLGNGLFTYYLNKTLENPEFADYDSDGIILFKELFDKVRDQVFEFCESNDIESQNVSMILNQSD